MSGRGVITSRTSVSPKSTMLCSSRRSSPSMIPSCSARVDVGLRGLVGSSRSPRSRLRRRAAPRSPARDRGDPAASSGRARGRPARTTAAAAPARAPGSRPTISSGSSSSQTMTKAATPTTTNGSVVRAVDADRRARAAPSRPPVTRPSSSRTGTNSSSGSSRYVAERAGPIAALGDEPQRQPHQRAERAPRSRRGTTAAHAEQENAERDHRRAAAAAPAR